MTAAELAQALGGQRAGKGWLAHCPAHDDQHPSLSITDGPGGRVLVKCMAGCSQEAVIAALRARGLWPAGERRIAATYDYVDAEGRLLFQVVRYEPKAFRQRRPDGKGGWIYSLDGVEPVLYRLPMVLAAIRDGRRVYITEGEKDADNLQKLGLVATTSPMGAGKWRQAYAETLRGAHVVIVPDKDEPGRKHAQQVARSLHGVAASVRVLELPGPGKDVSDWFAAGGTLDELERLADEAPEWQPGDEEASKPQSQGGKAEKPERQTRPILLRASDVEPEEPRWLFKPYIPRGAVTGLAGDPGIGKSFISCDLAARVTRGGPWPTPSGLMNLPPEDALAEPGRVIYATAEDDIAKTLRPRLEKLGADLSRVYFLAGKEIVPDPSKPDEQPMQAPVFLADEALEQAIAEVRPDLVIIDPIQAFLGPGVEMNKAEQVRPLLARLARLAEQYDCAIVFVGHLTKTGKDRAIYRVLGSVDLVGAIRSLLLAGTDPQDKSQRGLFHVKSNLAREGPALGYTIADDGSTGRFQWLGGTELTAAQVLAPEPTAEEEGALGQAIEFLREALADGPKNSKTLLRDAEAQGISRRTLFRAKERLGVRARKEAGKQHGSWVWELPEADGSTGTREHGTLGTLDTLPETTGFEGHGARVPTEQAGKVAKSAKSAKQECQGENPDTTTTPAKSAKSASLHHGPLVEVVATASHPPAALCSPVRRDDGSCYVCSGRRWWQASDGRWLCSTCYPPSKVQEWLRAA